MASRNEYDSLSNYYVTMTQQLFGTEEIAIPDISNLVIEDDISVDNFQSEKQQRLVFSLNAGKYIELT